MRASSGVPRVADESMRAKMLPVRPTHVRIFELAREWLGDA